MSYYQILKRLVLDFSKFYGTKKYYLLLLFGFITTFISALEPFWGANAIKIIQKYIEFKTINFEYIFGFFALWGGYIVINSLIRYFYRFNLVDLNILKYYTFKVKFYKDKILRVSQGTYLEKKPASIFKMVDRGTGDMFSVLYSLHLDLLISFISIITITFVIFFINFYLALAVFAVMPFVLYLGYYFNVKTRKIQMEVHKDWDKFFGVLGDFVTNLTLLKTLSFEKKVGQDLDDLQDATLKKQINISKKWGIADVYIQFMVNISRFFVLAVGIYLIVYSNLDFATLFLFYAYIGYIYFPISSIFSNLKNIQKSLESIKKLYEEMDEIPLDSDINGDLYLDKFVGEIEFKNVGFAYNSSKNVLENINFKINSGEKIALVGSTGSGKSTITNLILRFWEITSGKILLDGIEIHKFSKDFLRQNIGIVMQDNSLFNDSILQNMLYARPGASIPEITQALKKAKADFVFELKDGLQTVIGERGLKLSGGEKQRLNIARIFLKNPKFLILDEATSALDNTTESLIQSSLDELLVGKTSIIIAHRLSTIKKVDKIFVLKDGKIVETGTYDELINSKGYFFNLANPDKLIIS